MPSKQKLQRCDAHTRYRAARRDLLGLVRVSGHTDFLEIALLYRGCCWQPLRPPVQGKGVAR